MEWKIKLTWLIDIIEGLAVEMICIVVLIGACFAIHGLHEERKVISLVITVLEMVVLPHTIVLVEHVLIWNDFLVLQSHKALRATHSELEIIAACFLGLFFDFIIFGHFDLASLTRLVVSVSPTLIATILLNLCLWSSHPMCFSSVLVAFWLMVYSQGSEYSLVLSVMMIMFVRDLSWPASLDFIFDLICK